MGKETSISWCDHTFNLWWGCTEVGGSPACGEPGKGTECYAKAWARRCGFDIWGDDKERRYFDLLRLRRTLTSWNADAVAADVFRSVFVMSMGDWAEGRPEQKPYLDELWYRSLETWNLIYLMLTKRPQLITKLCPIGSQRIWQGTTVENQRWLNIRWPHLRDVDTAGGVKWFSIEPLFGSIQLPNDFLDLGPRAWVIVGGQSGGHAQTLELAAVRRLLAQCKEAGVPFHMKQLSQDYGPRFKVFDDFPADLRVRQFPEVRS